MNKYLLLRDNKQSGPYSFEELVEKGLKPYDLVWLDGKSAAWRYPSEFDELKPHAPLVEEQPFDRFYKKGAEQASSPSILEQRAQARAKKEAELAQAEHNKQQYHKEPKTEPKKQPAVPVEAETPAAAVEEKMPYTGAKKIYVTMPASPNRPTNSSQYNPKEFTAQPAHKEDYKRFEPVPANKKEADKPAVDKKQPVTINDTFQSNGQSTVTQTAEKEPLPDTHLQPRPRRDNRRLVMRSLVAACLLLGGVVIGLGISYYNSRNNTSELEKLVKQIHERQQANQPVNNKPVNESASFPVTDSLYSDSVAGGEENSSPAEVNKETRPIKELASNNREENPALHKKEKTTAQAHEPSTSIPVTSTSEELKVTPAVMNGNKEKTTPPQAAIESARKNIYSLVDVDANKYKVGVLGGISELYLTVSNNSQFALDQVSVEVKYFGPEKKLVKTQTMVFNDVAPGEQKTLEVPRSNRGVSLDYSITQINSRVLGLARAKF